MTETARTLDVTDPVSPAELGGVDMEDTEVLPTAGVSWTLGWCDVMITQPAKVHVRDKSYLDAQSDAMSTMSAMNTRTALHRQNSALGGNKKR